jgi:histidine triad (HIT) family protein
MVLNVELEPVDGVIDDACIFCAIVRGDAPAEIVLDEPAGIAFLDRRPLLPGHVLLVPRAHVPTLPDLPVVEIGPFFALVQRLTHAVTRATDADGAFVAVNNVVSQSVPHLHVHIVPRRHDDRLFSRNLAWTRRPYRNDEEKCAIAEAIRSTLSADERTSTAGR